MSITQSLASQYEQRRRSYIEAIQNHASGVAVKSLEELAAVAQPAGVDIGLMAADVAELERRFALADTRQNSDKRCREKIEALQAKLDAITRPLIELENRLRELRVAAEPRIAAIESEIEKNRLTASKNYSDAEFMLRQSALTAHNWDDWRNAKLPSEQRRLGSVNPDARGQYGDDWRGGAHDMPPQLGPDIPDPGPFIRA